MKNITKLLLILGGTAVISVAAVCLFRKKNGRSFAALAKGAGPIVAEASKWVGQKEISPNQGWKDKDFEKKMVAAGWVKGSPYCASFVRMVMMEVAKGDSLDFVKKNMNASAQSTYNNLAKSNNFCEKISEPEPDCIVCYQHHTEICEGVNDDGTINVISANSLFSDGSEGVVAKKRAAGKAIDDDPFLGYIRFTKLS